MGTSTYHGQHDRIPLDAAGAVKSSLTLIHVSTLRLRVFKPGEAFGDTKRRVQARFRFGAINYALRVTDPIIERAYLAQADGSYIIGESYLTVSLGEPFNDNVYKLVAAVIRRQSDDHV